MSKELSNFSTEYKLSTLTVVFAGVDRTFVLRSSGFNGCYIITSINKHTVEIWPMCDSLGSIRLIVLDQERCNRKQIPRHPKQLLHCGLENAYDTRVSLATEAV